MPEVGINDETLRSDLIGDMLSKAPGFATLDDSPCPGVGVSRPASLQVDH